MQRILVTGLLLAGVAASPDVSAIEYGDFENAVKESSIKFGLRYRYEYVDQDGIDDEAGASTLRGRMTWNSGNVGSWSALVEADYVALIGSERYNSTENRRTNFPVVADPEGFDLNQALIRYKGDSATFTFGRQRVVHADQRFVGGVAWRQNEQTFDAARAEFGLGQVKVDYSYVWNVNRIFGPRDGAQPADWRGDSHLLNLSTKLADNHQLSGYAYVLDFDNDNGVPNSTATYGIAYTGTMGIAKLNLGYATQSDHGDSPLDYDADFYTAELQLSLKPVKLTAGYQVLGSDDGVAAFRTPLATLHKFQGWADKFLLTPANGIEDAYVGVGGMVGPVNLSVTYHQFESDENSLDYGDEINAVATWKIRDKMNAQLKFAQYDADELATDTTKIWLTLNISL